MQSWSLWKKHKSEQSCWPSLSLGMGKHECAWTSLWWLCPQLRQQLILLRTQSCSHWMRSWMVPQHQVTVLTILHSGSWSTLHWLKSLAWGSRCFCFTSGLGWRPSLSSCRVITAGIMGLQSPMIIHVIICPYNNSLPKLLICNFFSYHSLFCWAPSLLTFLPSHFFCHAAYVYM